MTTEQEEFEGRPESPSGDAGPIARTAPEAVTAAITNWKLQVDLQRAPSHFLFFDDGGKAEAAYAALCGATKAWRERLNERDRSLEVVDDFGRTAFDCADIGTVRLLHEADFRARVAPIELALIESQTAAAARGDEKARAVYVEAVRP